MDSSRTLTRAGTWTRPYRFTFCILHFALCIVLGSVPAFAYWNPQTEELPTPAWSVGPGGYWGFRSTPVLAGGAIYCGSLAKSVYCVDANTGQVQWNTPVGGRVTFSSPAVADGTVVVGSEDGKVYGLDAASGAVRWTADAGGRVEGSVSIADGRAFVGSTANRLLAINLADGSVAWQADADGPVFGRPLLADGRVYFGTEGIGEGKTFYCLSQDTGREVFRVAAGGAIYSSPALAAGRVYFGSMDKKVYGVDAATGAVLWTRELPGPIGASPLVSDDTVVIGCQDQNVYGLNADTGEVRWTFPLQFTWQMEADREGKIPPKGYFPNLASPILYQGQAVLPIAYGVLFVAVTDGTLSHTTLLADPCDAPGVAIGDGRLYVAHRNAIQAFELR